MNLEHFAQFDPDREILRLSLHFKLQASVVGTDNEGVIICVQRLDPNNVPVKSEEFRISRSTINDARNNDEVEQLFLVYDLLRAINKLINSFSNDENAVHELTYEALLELLSTVPLGNGQVD